jgi:hypothetical protein
MRKLVLAGVIVILSCSGGSSSKDGGPVDPGALDFCLDYANSVCRLAYLCTDTAAQDATFHARYGASMDDCWQGIEKLCTSNQSGSTAFGPSCGPGKKVNDAAATVCADSLLSTTCTEWTATPSGAACQSVCSTATTGTGGTNTGTGGTNTGTGGTNTGTGGTSTGNGSVATPLAFCTTGGNLQCERAFECDPAGSASTFGNVAGCKALFDATCPDASCPMSFSATLAASCIAAMKAATCQELMGPTPTVCESACQ